MNKKYQVFVSSTFEDLKKERAKIFSALLDNDCIPTGMEQFHAIPLSQWDYITKMIDISDYYVLIVAGRYGSIDEKTGKSFTEAEFDYAMQKQVPVLAFLHSNPQDIPLGKSERNTNMGNKLVEFRKRIENSGLLVDYYTDENDLCIKVITSIHKAVACQKRPGWIRADEVKFIMEETESEFKSEIKKLKQDMLELQKRTRLEITTEEDIEKIFEEYLEKHTANDDEVKKMLDDVFGKK